jgi:hypothetical protein
MTAPLQRSPVQEEAIRFYCGLGEKHYNHHPVVTGPFACVSPVSGSEIKKVNSVAVPAGALVLQDSGAFNDACLLLRGQERHLTMMKQCRLSFKEALKRQERHALDFGYADQLQARASYDVLIDETWTEDVSGLLTRRKKRWSETDADLAVEETIAAAAYLDQHRNGIPCIMSAQGVSPQQYLHCVERILPYVREGDLVGLGGWCILGRLHSLLPAFRETMRVVIPFLKREGIRRVHIWGVCFAEALGELLWLCDHDEEGNLETGHRVQLSTDSVGPSTRPVKRNMQTGYATWGYASWCNPTYPAPPVLDSCKVKDAQGDKTPTCAPQTRCRGLERGRHVLLTREWFADFRLREPRLYRAPCYQASWVEVGS